MLSLLFAFLAAATVTSSPDPAILSSPTPKRIVQSAEDRYREKLELKIQNLEKLKTQRLERIEKAKEQELKLRTDFKERLKLVKSQARRQAIESIQNRLSQSNERWVNHWGEALERLNKIVLKIEARNEEIQSQNVKTSLDNAKKAIENAQLAINNQAAETYPIEIIDDQTVGEVVREVVKLFKADIQETREKIVLARESVAASLQVLKAAEGQKEEES